MIEIGIYDYDFKEMSKEKICSIAKYRYEEIGNEYRYWDRSLLRPWRRVHLYKTLNHIYQLVIECISYNKETKESVYNFRDDYKDNVKIIEEYREDNYKKSERLQIRLDDWGYDRDMNRERIMYKQIYQECDILLKMIKHYETSK